MQRFCTSVPLQFVGQLLSTSFVPLFQIVEALKEAHRLSQEGAKQAMADMAQEMGLPPELIGNKLSAGGEGAAPPS